MWLGGNAVMILIHKYLIVKVITLLQSCYMKLLLTNEVFMLLQNNPLKQQSKVSTRRYK